MIASTVFPTLKAHMPILTSNGATRIWQDYAGDSPVTPYAVWSPIASVPHNNLDRAPSDTHGVTVDVFSRTQQESDALIRKARDAMEAIGYVETIQSLGYDSVTKLWRYTLSAEIQVNRPN